MVLLRFIPKCRPLLMQAIRRHCPKRNIHKMMYDYSKEKSCPSAKPLPEPDPGDAKKEGGCRKDTIVKEEIKKRDGGPCRGGKGGGGTDGTGKDGEGKDGEGKGGGGIDGGGTDGGGTDGEEPQHQDVYARPVRLSEPGKVRLGLIPEEWFDFFYTKTGVTGPYIFLLTVGTYLVSKEKYVLEHEFYGGLSMGVLCILGVKYVGPTLSKFLDKEIDQYERMWIQLRFDEIKYYEDMIREEERSQLSMEGQLILLNAKRENIQLQLEAIYRERLVYVHNQVKDRLDYHVTTQFHLKKLLHRNLIDWVVKEVVQAYQSGKVEDDFELCLKELEEIAARERALI